MSKWRLILFLLGFYAVSAAGLPTVNVTIHGKGTKGPYSLGYSNIILSSFSIAGDSGSFASDAFNLQASAGLVYLAEPLSPADSLIAVFSYVPLTLDSQYALHSPYEGMSEPRKTAGSKSNASKSYYSDLSITGSKGFSIETGAGAGGLSQSLNLTINGDIVSGLKTSAHISDKSAGGGVSRRINELDKIYITAESENFKGTFGDFDYTEKRGEFFDYNRKLTGLNIDFGKNDYSLKAGAAFFPGQYSSMTILGVDGRLGPYYLKDSGGRTGVAVLSGSEKVYIDGVFQKRGADNDYTIDYEAGAIEFIPSKIITSQSRITVDYEISRDDYGRSFYSAGGDYGSDSGFKFFGGMIQEGDRSNSPRSFVMTSENKAILGQAGADKLATARSGAAFVGPDSGSYNIQTDSLGNSIYVYAGAGQGDYDVVFSFIGTNAGSYRPLGTGIFEYAGSGYGDYEPVILLPLPSINRYGTAGAAYETADSTLFAKVELAGSSKDRNTLSKVDNLQNGYAGSIIAGIGRTLGDDGFLRLSGKLRDISSNALFPGRVDRVERYRQYDLEPETGPSDETLQELRLEGGSDELHKADFELGFLTKSGIKNRNRQAANLNWRLWDRIDAFGSMENTHGDRTWQKRSGSLTGIFGSIRPYAGVEYERRDGANGFQFYQYKSSVPAKYYRSVTGSTELIFRNEKYLADVWRDKFRSGSVQQNVAVIAGESGFTGEVSGSYFKKQYRDFTGTDSDQKSGIVRLTYTNPRGLGNILLNERLTSSNERLKTKTYLFVGSGNGDYRLEDGEYVSDPDGDYVLVIEELGEGSSISDISTEISGAASPLLIIDRSKELESSIGRLNLETDLTYRLKKSSNRLIGRDFAPWRDSKRSNALFVQGRLDLRAYFYPARTKHRIKYSGFRSFQDGNPYVNETVTESMSSDEVSWAFPAASNTDMLLSGLISSHKSDLNGLKYSIKRHKESAKIDYEFARDWIFEVTAGYENARQSDIGLTAEIPSGEAGIIKAFQNKGRISANFAYYRLIAKPKGTYIIYQLAQGKREGNNYSAGAKARLELYKNGRLDFIYRYEKFADRAQKHYMRTEFTILFQ